MKGRWTKPFPQITPALLKTLLGDALVLLRASRITTTADDSTSPLDTSPLRRTFLVLSDVSRLFSGSLSSPQTPHRPQQAHITHKLSFYAAHVYFKYAADPEAWDLMVKIVDMKLRALESTPHQDDGGLPAATYRQKTNEPRIQEV